MDEIIIELINDIFNTAVVNCKMQSIQFIKHIHDNNIM